jgi:hypothetical protein
VPLRHRVHCIATLAMKVSGFPCGFSCMCGHNSLLCGRSLVCGGFLPAPCLLPLSIDISAVELQASCCHCGCELQRHLEHCISAFYRFSNAPGCDPLSGSPTTGWSATWPALPKTGVRLGSEHGHDLASCVALLLILVDLLPVDSSRPGALLQLLMKLLVASRSGVSHGHCPCLCLDLAPFQSESSPETEVATFCGRPPRLSFAS